MIKTRKDLNFYLAEDAWRNDSSSFYKYMLGLVLGREQAYAYRYLKALRHCEYHYNNKGFIHKFLYFLYKIKLGRLGFRYHLEMPLNAVGYGCRLLHISGGGGILLNINRAGNYCGFNSGVLIGQKGPNEKPSLGDYVVFAPGSKAIGAVKIGNNVFVAPNAVVVRDVPADCIVGGIPAKIIKRNDTK